MSEGIKLIAAERVRQMMSHERKPIGAKRPINRPCSACGDGDTDDHYPPEVKLDIYPDGWGMKIDPAAQVSPEEAIEIIKAIQKAHNKPPEE